MVKTLKFIVENIVFDVLEGCMCERERYQKNIKSGTKIHPKIDTKIMLEKGIPTRWKIIKKMIQKGDEKLEKTRKSKHVKKMRKDSKNKTCEKR